MNAKQLLDQGKVLEAIKALSSHLRDNPGDLAQRTFLFELLCFAGEYDRAQKHLGVLAEANADTAMGSILYNSALYCEKTRAKVFDTKAFPKDATVLKSPPGQLNGKPFESIADVDSRIGASLEVFAAGTFMFVPFSEILSLHLEQPSKLRHTLWFPAQFVPLPSFKSLEGGQILIPVIYPFSNQLDEESVWLGRSTEFVQDQDGNEFPVGQKTFIVDGEEIPLLEVRSLEFAPAGQ